MMRLTSTVSMLACFTLLAACAPSIDEDLPQGALPPRVALTDPVVVDAGVPDADASVLSAPAACKLDTAAVVVTGGRVVQTVTTRGRHYAFEGNGAPWQSNGVDLTAMPRYAGGPCKGRAAGTCELDTRTYVTIGGELLEAITAYGRAYTFEGEHPGANNGKDLTEIPRFAKGPCQGRAPGECKLDTRTYAEIGNRVVESITAYGKGYQFELDGTPLPSNGLDLSQIPAYANGPCKGAAPQACVFDTRTLDLVGGTLVETITAGGTVYRFVAAGPAAGAIVQPSNVPVSSVRPWSDGPCN